jgi:hypothetical protein
MPTVTHRQEYRSNNSRLFAVQVAAKGDTNQAACHSGIAERREPERSEIHNRESEHLDSTAEAGELILNEDPPEGSEMPHHTTDVGNYVECSVT